jgi:glutaredoxin
MSWDSDKEVHMASLPIVYTIKGCSACVKLAEKWDAEGIKYEERRADLSQELMDEARALGNVVPIIIYPDGRVEEGFEGGIGCYIG